MIIQSCGWVVSESFAEFFLPSLFSANIANNGTGSQIPPKNTHHIPTEDYETHENDFL
jgi:hypothetical protein